MLTPIFCPVVLKLRVSFTPFYIFSHFMISITLKMPRINIYSQFMAPSIFEGFPAKQLIQHNCQSKLLLLYQLQLFQSCSNSPSGSSMYFRKIPSTKLTAIKLIGEFLVLIFCPRHICTCMLLSFFF